MGTVHLTNGHHGLCIRGEVRDSDLETRILLNDELLERPVIHTRGLPLDQQNQNVTRSALRGLMELNGFNAAVSYAVVTYDGALHIASPHRVWGEITLAGPREVIVPFSHDSRFENRPFTLQLEWLEGEYPAGTLSESDFARFCRSWSSSEKWTQLFQDRIRRVMDAKRNEALYLRNEADAVMREAKAIKEALG